MPAQLPRAAFEPLSPDLDVEALVESTPNFEHAPRIPFDSIEERGLEMFEKLISLHVIVGGKPLVVEGIKEHLDPSVFSERWLRQHHSSKKEIVRDLVAKSNFALTIGHYLKNMPLLADQWNARNYKDPDRQRIYLKDIDCPELWRDQLKEVMPPSIFYFNEARRRLDDHGASNGYHQKHDGDLDSIPLSIAGDLMSCLPPEMRAENLMCYIGHEGTYTPAHREMCGTLGQNAMVEASTGSIEYGKATKPGSSIWFMTENKQRDEVSEYWLSTLGHDIEIEDHFAQLNAWKAAPFKTYIVEQRPGDLILVPPLAPHQVWNRGTRTMKVAWNRTTVETLELALNEALPRARMVCRDEQYKTKATVYYALQDYSRRVGKAESLKVEGPEIRQLQKDFERLFALYTQILLSETFSDSMPEKNVVFEPFESNVICSYCRCNIFNRFLTCPWCPETKISGVEWGPYDVCMECYAMGRSCHCVSKLKWVEQFRWDDLLENHEKWRLQILNFPKYSADRALPFSEARRRFDRKPLAEICQEQLRIRPWTDITKPVEEVGDGDDSCPDDAARAKKRRKLRRSRKAAAESPRCHVCKNPEAAWKLVTCAYCDSRYCYGSLFRAFNLHPQKVMEQLKWKCPKCQKICNCGACRKNPSMTPHQPTTTLLGHDTKKIADPRSVESLVNFGCSNVQWLKKAGEAGDEQPQEKRRRKQPPKEAERKVQIEQKPIHGHYIEFEIDEYFSENNGSYVQDDDEIPVDPALTLDASGMSFIDGTDIASKHDASVDLSRMAKTALNTL